MAVMTSTEQHLSLFADQKCLAKRVSLVIKEIIFSGMLIKQKRTLTTLGENYKILELQHVKCDLLYHNFIFIIDIPHMYLKFTYKLKH